jgi:hypothetical protein
MANITVKVEDEVLVMVKRFAAEQGTSVSAIVADKLREMARRSGKKREALEALEGFYGTIGAVVGKRSWTRDELHER